MEKYGVTTTREKSADLLDDKGTCPSCGKKVITRGRTVLCETCGSEPFEEKEED